MVGFGRIRSDLVGFAHIRSDSVRFGRILIFGKFGRIWSYSVGFGHIWSYSVIFGRIWSDSVRFGTKASTGGACNITFSLNFQYLAPEVLRKQSYDKSVDWWCLGAVTYEMMYGLPPFYSRDTAEMYDNILHKPLRLRTNISQSARHLLEQVGLVGIYLRKFRVFNGGCI